MRTFKRVFKNTFLEEWHYKSAFVSGIICQFAFGLMYIMLYNVFFENGVPQDFNGSQMATYVWLGQAFFAIFCFTDLLKKEISYPIMNGDVGYQFVKPVNIYKYWFMQVLSKPISMAIMRGVPIFIICFLLPAGIGMTLPVSFAHFALFALSLTLGVILLSAFRMICYGLVLYTLDGRGVFTIMGAFFSLLSGGVVPIPLMPEGVQKVLNFMPFRYVNDLPYRIYIGNIDLKTAYWQIGVQVVWIILLVSAGYFLITRKSKKLVVQGG